MITTNAQDVRTRLKPLHPDRLTVHLDGTATARWSYFYTFGRSAQQYAEKIRQALPNAIILEAYDGWAPWPKTSYFTVRFTWGR